jgi:protein-tyrosine phosphatase
VSNIDHFTVLCVCTGNICRSPAAERLLGARLGPTVSVTSAGTFGLVGSPITEPTARLLRKAGAPADGFAARRLTAGLLRSADLVLAMTTGHRRDVVELAPAVVRRTFTLRELARLLEDLEPGELPDGPPATRLRAAVTILATRRTPSTLGDDIDDPFGRPDAAYQRAFDEIDEATARIAAVIR